MVSGRPVLKFTGVDNPEAAARLTNRELAVSRDKTVPLPEGSFYLFDLIGCQVYDEGSDESLGEVVDVQQYPANDAYIIEMADGRRTLLAAIEQYVKQIDIGSKKIVIDAAGLVDTP